MAGVLYSPPLPFPPFFSWAEAVMTHKKARTQKADFICITPLICKAVGLTPCPIGVNGSNPNYYVYIVGGPGASEAAPVVTGGTCVSGAASGTILVDPANSHTAGYSIGSATAGIKEASEDAKTATLN